MGKDMTKQRTYRTHVLCALASDIAAISNFIGKTFAKETPTSRLVFNSQTPVWTDHKRIMFVFVFEDKN